MCSLVQLLVHWSRSDVEVRSLIHSHFLRPMLLSLLPHMRWYHTRVPCRCWGSVTVPCATVDTCPALRQFSLPKPPNTDTSKPPPHAPESPATPTPLPEVPPFAFESPPTPIVSATIPLFSMPLLLEPLGVLPSSGGVTSSPMLPLRAILMALLWFDGWEAPPKDIPKSSKLLFLLALPTAVRPCLREFERRNRISSTTRREFERPLYPEPLPTTVGLSGSDRELALVVRRGGGRGAV